MTRLRKMMLEELHVELLRTYHTLLHPHSRRFCRRFNRPPDRLGLRHIRRIPSRVISKGKSYRRGTVNKPPRGAAVFLHQDSQEGLEHRRDSLSERPFHLPSILSQEEVTQLIDAALTPYHRILLMTLYATGVRNAELTTLESQRHRQQAHGDSHSRWQGTQRSRCDAQPKTA